MKNKVNIVLPAWFKALFNKETLTGKGSGGDLKCIVIPLIITLILAAAEYYIGLVPIHIKSTSFWAFMIIQVILYIFIKAVYMFRKKTQPALKRPAILLLVLILVMVLGGFFSARIFHARAYSRIITVTEGNIEDIPSQEGSGAIALMDTASAQRLGDREIGSLTELVSQFNVGEYTQIDYQSRPVKVAALSFDGFFKWFNNRQSGVPGYVLVDPVDMDADYIALDAGMVYAPSAWFQKNIYRHIRFSYPNLMFRNAHFEIDEEGKPWYVAPYYTCTIGLFGGEQVMGAVVADPVNGDVIKYAAADVPRWVDVVYDGDLICAQYNDAAQLQNGFINTLIGQKDCRRVTTVQGSDDDEESGYPDFGYVAKEGDIWIYTGVTSVNGDSSNLGFILSNERTEETRFITVAGADEFSAMRSAEGEVQEKRYSASFPSLINVDDIPTYIMVLKDANGLVKMYAAVNVRQYNLVATASTQKACIDKYKMLINGEISSDQAVNTEEVVPEIDTSAFTEKEITIRKTETIDKQGNTYIYVVDMENHIYNAKYADVIGMLLYDAGDTITILTDGTHFILPEE